MTRPNYAYQSSQRSILLPSYRRYLWNAILDRLPRSLSPNAMTALSTVCCAASFLIATTFRESRLAMLSAAVLVLAYFTLDNLDGAQARRIGRSSRLGEFLDHWLDTLNNGFVVLGVCIAAGLPSALAFGVLGFASLAFFAVQWELFCTGVFRVGRVGDIEGNTAVVLIYLTLAIFGSQALQATPIAGFGSLAVWMGCGVTAQAIWTLVAALSRVRERRADFLPVAVAHLVVAAWALSGGLGPAAYLTVAFFLNPVFTARPVCGRLLGLGGPRLDWAVVVLLLAASLPWVAGLSKLPGDALGLVIAVCLAAVTLRHFGVAVVALRREPGTDEGVGVLV